MFISYNYFRQHNDGTEIKDYKEFYKKFSNDREFGGTHTNLDYLKKARFTNTLGHMNNIILRQEPKAILDIGCGDGTNLPLSRLFPDIRYCGIDYAEKAVAAAKKDYPDVEFKVGDAFHLPYEDNSFDMAILSSVLILYKEEEDRIALLEEAYRILKNDGILVLNLWNDTFLIRNSIRFSRIIGKMKGDKLPKDFMGLHFKYYDAKHMIDRTSFRIEERIKTAHLTGMLESIQYVNRKKYHRQFGREQTAGKRMSQNLKKDLFAEAGSGGGGGKKILLVVV